MRGGPADPGLIDRLRRDYATLRVSVEGQGHLPVTSLIDAASELAALDALRLPCPTCGGSGDLLDLICDNCGASASLPLGQTCENHLAKPLPCPDCTDGLMSHERAWKIVAAVYDPTAYHLMGRDYLRGIR